MVQETSNNKGLTIKDLLRSRGNVLDLNLVTGASHLSREITASVINRPGLAIAGHLEQFKSKRIQIIGQGEHAFCLKSKAKDILTNLDKMFAGNDVPCIIFTGGLKAPTVFREAAKKVKIPLLVTSMPTARFIRELTIFLDDKLAAITHIHGVLVNVYGFGVLIQGDSGVGKSECALELLKRGHILIADDVVEVKRRIGYMLIGHSPRNISHHMEVRGLGIIDIELLFGIGATMDQSIIEMQVFLETVNNLKNYDRTGLASDTVNILDVNIPSLRVPVTPGRNLAILIEVAALNQRLKNQGHNAAKKFNEDLIKKMKRK
ncbi:MAG: HPr(Ser) kinase/phosphatase [Elusimicrobia bacterium]|nr:HPr(Ser) kinase/phosphatase [Elusimicrobiota bacterium]